MDGRSRPALEDRPQTTVDFTRVDDWPEPSAEAPLFGRCRACGEAVFADRAACRHCGYDLDDHDRRRLSYGALGTALTLSGVFAPVGLPLLWRAHCHRRLADGSVAAADDAPLGDHLLAVLRDHLSLASPTDA